jgi:hypothetical protein
VSAQKRYGTALAHCSFGMIELDSSSESPLREEAELGDGELIKL